MNQSLIEEGLNNNNISKLTEVIKLVNSQIEQHLLIEALKRQKAETQTQVQLTDRIHQNTF